MTARWSRLGGTRGTGVSPLGAEVRTAAGGSSEVDPIYEQHGPLLSAGLIGSAGHSVVKQTWMAASSRWVGRGWSFQRFPPGCRSSHVRLAGW